MAAIQLDQKADEIENVLFSTLMDRTVAPPQNRGNGVSGDPLASSTWEEVPPENTLISPVQCKSIWRRFIAETEYTVTQAITSQEDLDTQVCHRRDVDPDIIENEALQIDVESINKNMNNVIYDTSEEEEEEEDDTLNEYYSEDEKSLDSKYDNADSDIDSSTDDASTES